MIPALPLAVGFLAVAAWYKRKGKKEDTGALTPSRKIIYETALNTEKDPAKLEILAEEFEKQGLKGEAVLLRKRANLKKLPQATKDARQEAFRKGMRSTDAAKILKLADAFNKEGASGASSALARYAKGISIANKAIKNNPIQAVAETVEVVEEGA
jgi:hypothetical protein